MRNNWLMAEQSLHGFAPPNISSVIWMKIEEGTWNESEDVTKLGDRGHIR